MAHSRFHASRWKGEAMENERFNRRLSANLHTPRQLAHKALVALGIQAYVIQDKRPAKAVCGRHMALQERRPAAQEDGGHGAGVQPALGNGGQQAAGIGSGLPVDDLPNLFACAAGLTPETALDLCRRHGQAQGAAHLLRDLVQTADHAQL